jgi:hypothetical protein
VINPTRRRRRWGAGRARFPAGWTSGSTSACTRSWLGRSNGASSATRSSSTSPASALRSAPPAFPAPTRPLPRSRVPPRPVPISEPSPIASASPAPRTSGTRTTGPSAAPSSRRIRSPRVPTSGNNWILGSPEEEPVGRTGMIFRWSHRGLGWMLEPVERSRPWPRSTQGGNTERWLPPGCLTVRRFLVCLLRRGRRHYSLSLVRGGVTV